MRWVPSVGPHRYATREAAVPVTTDQPTPHDTRAGIAVRALVAVPLAVSAYLHYDLAAGPLAGDGKITLAGLFIAQAVVATIVLLWLLVRGERVALIAGALVGLGSLAALVLSTYVEIPAIGPMPAIYEPIWYAEKVVAAAAAGFGGLMALMGLARPKRT